MPPLALTNSAEWVSHKLQRLAMNPKDYHNSCILTTIHSHPTHSQGINSPNAHTFAFVKTYILRAFTILVERSALTAFGALLSAEVQQRFQHPSGSLSLQTVTILFH